MMSYRMLQLMDGCTILFRFRSAYPSSATRNDLPAFRIRLIQPCDHEQIAPRMTQAAPRERSEEHTSELQSLMRISYAVFCLKKKKTEIQKTNTHFHNHIQSKYTETPIQITTAIITKYTEIL